jgi:hypothetical protein
MVQIGPFVVNSYMSPLPFDDQYFDFVILSLYSHISPKTCSLCRCQSSAELSE